MPLNNIPNQIYSSFKDIFKDGKLIKVNREFNDGNWGPEISQEYSIKLLREDYSDFYKFVGNLGKDLKFIVLQKSIPNNIQITTDDKIEFENKTYKIKDVNQDPTNAIYQIQVIGD